MEVPVSAAILRGVAKIFRPIRSIANLHIRPKQTSDISCKRLQVFNRRKTVCAANLGQTTHFRPDAKGCYTTCRGA